MSTHYIELAQTEFTQIGSGEIIYHGPEVSHNGENAIDFDQSIISGSDEIIMRIPLDEINPGTYKWLRSSLGYQNYTVPFRSAGYDLSGTVASFVGFNTYISEYP